MSPGLGVLDPLTLDDKCCMCNFGGTEEWPIAFTRLLKFKNWLNPASSLGPHSGLGRVYRSPCPVPAQWRAASDCQPSAGRAGREPTGVIYPGGPPPATTGTVLPES